MGAAILPPATCILDVLDHTKIVLVPNATSNTSSNFFLGRPWRSEFPLAYIYP
jgi:hypothetical protein